MKKRLNSVAAAAFGVLLIACVAAWLLTRDTNPQRPSKKANAPAARVSKVDQKLLDSARQLAALADTRSEQELALEAVRLANQEVDQDFATSIREAAAIAVPATGRLHDLAARVDDLRSRIAATQQRVAQLTKQAATDKLDVVNAQLTLYQDELADAQGDLERAGGDEHATLERAQQALQAARQTPVALGKLAPAAPPATLGEQLEQWFALGSRQSQIQAARQYADQKYTTLTAEHKQIEDKIAPTPQTGDDDDTDTDDPATVVAQLRGLSDTRKTLADLDKRAQSCQQLSGVYQQWEALLDARRRVALHAMTGLFCVILAILLAASIVKAVLGRILARQSDRRRVHQLSVVIRIAVNAVAVIFILLVIFGAPTQMPTIIGLAGAGLTVVLKDFIVAFFGWFVLMGRNGLRLGDWVEINGVGGEVIEIGVLKTVLLEMGNWTNTGHPTGRRVSFMNGFAIEGHYFNFSTAGQWLWDELQVTVPSGDPYVLAEQIRQIVEKETEADAKLAEEEWERVTHQYGMRPFSARPAADLRPGPTGLVVNIRYITRAPQRYEVKSRLFQAIVSLMHKSDQDRGAGALPAAAS